MMIQQEHSHRSAGARCSRAFNFYLTSKMVVSAMPGWNLVLA